MYYFYITYTYIHFIILHSTRLHFFNVHWTSGLTHALQKCQNYPKKLCLPFLGDWPWKDKLNLFFIIQQLINYFSNIFFVNRYWKWIQKYPKVLNSTHLSPTVPKVKSKYLEEPQSTKKYQKVHKSTNKYQKVHNNNIKYSIKQISTQEYQKVPRNT